MVTTSNGFELAEADLEMRGPGEYFGTRQSGLPELRVAKLTDHQTLNLARNWANRILDDDPHLRAPEHRLPPPPGPNPQRRRRHRPSTDPSLLSPREAGGDVTE